jgi:hypothetical protein
MNSFSVSRSRKGTEGQEGSSWGRWPITPAASVLGEKEDDKKDMPRAEKSPIDELLAPTETDTGLVEPTLPEVKDEVIVPKTSCRRSAAGS